MYLSELLILVYEITNYKLSLIKLIGSSISFFFLTFLQFLQCKYREYEYIHFAKRVRFLNWTLIKWKLDYQRYVKISLKIKIFTFCCISLREYRFLKIIPIIILIDLKRNFFLIFFLVCTSLIY